MEADSSTAREASFTQVNNVLATKLPGNPSHPEPEEAKVWKRQRPTSTHAAAPSRTGDRADCPRSESSPRQTNLDQGKQQMTTVRTMW